MRKLLVIAILIMGVIFILSQFTELTSVANTLRRGDWRYLLLALGVEALWLVNVAASFRSIYRCLGPEEKLGKLILMAAAANFVNIVMPSGGMGGMAVFISESRRKEYSAGQATVAVALYLIFDYAAFLCVLMVGFGALLRRGKLLTSEIIAAGVIFLIALAVALVLYLGSRSEELLGRFLAWMARLANKIVAIFRRKKGDLVSIERTYTFAHDIADGVTELKSNPKRLRIPFLLALSNKALLTTILFLCFMAFDVPYSAGTVIAGFGIAYLFLIVSPTPSGVGFVEGALTLALVSFYIPLGEAAVVTIAYRAITFWVPLFFGMIAFRMVGNHRESTPSEESLA